MHTTLELLPTLELEIDPVAQRHHLTEWSRGLLCSRRQLRGVNPQW